VLKPEKGNDMKTYLVINTSFFGDTLLTDPLCRNIKRQYPASRIVFMANKPFIEAAKYMDSVDEVLAYDKKGEHKGLKGFWKFYNAHKAQYKNKIEAAFVIYGNERGIVLARLWGAKKIYSDNNGLISLLLDNGAIDYSGKTHTQDKHGALFELYSGKTALAMPMRYLPPREAKERVNMLWDELGIRPEDEVIALCTTSKRPEKDMPVAECVKLIRGLRAAGKKVLYVGAGQTALDYVNALYKHNCHDFINLTNRTSIPVLAAALQRSKAAVSVDTGTMHLVCAVDTPLVALFYVYNEQHVGAWAPKEFYPHRLLAGANLSVDDMLKAVEELTAERTAHD
jgi:ADP-heptose:LPS heptosyltransferase